MREPFTIALIALPWSARERPSAALAALAAYVRAKRPHIEVYANYAYLDFGEQLGAEVYDELATDFNGVAELLYLPILYPERTEFVRDAFLSAFKTSGFPWNESRVRDPNELSPVFDHVLQVLRRVIDSLARDLVARAPKLIGLTTCFGQLFGNIALARAVRRFGGDAKIVLGGSTVSDRVGVSIMDEYSEIDFIVQGEGELSLIALVDAVEGGSTAVPEGNGILSRSHGEAPKKSAEFNELLDLDALPIPEFDEYAERADAAGVGWLVPIEGSRGCWWDRTRRANNPKATCYFCNLNVQWKGYREKSSERVASELAQLTERYSNLRVFFLDNIIRAKGADDLARRIKAHGREYDLFYELRANLRPIEFLELWEAGLHTAQFGIEALSTSLLRRIGKGTTLLQNLQAMRLCTEFGVSNGANLIMRFPGSTVAEVEETLAAIELACAYQPPTATGYHLGVGSTVDVLQTQFPIANVRNRDLMRAGFPAEVFERLRLFDLSFDHIGEVADWTPVLGALEAWRVQYEKPRDHLLLYYRDGGSFLTLHDYRFGDFREGTLRGLQREIYLYCMQVRSTEQVSGRFASQGARPQDIEEILEALCDSQLLYTEDNHHLSLAMATSTAAAGRRIRQHFEEDTAAKGKRRTALPVAL